MSEKQVSHVVSIELPADGIDSEAVEKSFLEQALSRSDGNQSSAARLLSISRYALRYRMQKFKIESGVPVVPTKTRR
jgi:DNA-binding NtrC family response regulator